MVDASKKTVRGFRHENYGPALVASIKRLSRKCDAFAAACEGAPSSAEVCRAEAGWVGCDGLG